MPAACPASEIAAMIDVLKAALAAQDVEAITWPDPRLHRLTPQQRSMVGALYGVFPKGLEPWVLLDLLPGLDRAIDRSTAQVRVVASKVNAVLGRGSIEHVRCLGYRLSPELYAELRKAEPPHG